MSWRDISDADKANCDKLDGELKNSHLKDCQGGLRASTSGSWVPTCSSLIGLLLPKGGLAASADVEERYQLPDI